jgi:hypothetical protein
MGAFTPTKDLVKRKNYFKRSAFIMQVRAPSAHACTHGFCASRTRSG